LPLLEFRRRRANESRPTSTRSLHLIKTRTCCPARRGTNRCDSACTVEGRRRAPGFTDYLYVSITNPTVFSPTDTMSLSARAKLLMAVESVESVSALTLSVLVIAFGVGLLKH
jgi:hypothetical protein